MSCHAPAPSPLDSTRPEQTHALGRALGRVLEPGHVVGLVGELGAGKTALCAGVAEGMDVPAEIYVSSPTFTLVNEYPGRFPLVHIDLYRLVDPDELWEIGVDDYYRGLNRVDITVARSMGLESIEGLSDYIELPPELDLTWSPMNISNVHLVWERDRLASLEGDLVIGGGHFAGIRR